MNQMKLTKVSKLKRCCFQTWLVFILLSIWGISAFAQMDERINPNTSPLSNVERMIMPYQDNKKLLQEELAARAPGRAPHFAVPIEVFITPENHGTWEVTEDDMAVWRMRIYSQGAKSLNLGFTKYYMPERGSLILYSPDYQIVMGPFTPADNEEHEQLWTPILPDDEIVIEVQVPVQNMEELQLELKYVNHDFLGFGDPKGILSGACNLDVLCGADDGWGIVDDYRDIIQSVAVIGLNGSTFCTGFLVNNTAQDCTPYFMTADHCGISSSNAASLVAYWNYQNSTCRQPGSSASGGPGDGVLTDFNTGAIFRAGYGPSDFTLVELDDPVSETANAFFAGWSAEPVAHDTAICVHHPNTEEKRISFEFDAGMLTQVYSEAPSPNNYTHVRVVDWDLGTTEPGSSGSPLFDQNKRVIGQLTGGGAACGNDLSDWFGAISISWEGGGTPNTRLKDWLDPDNTGILTLDGRSQLSCSYAVTPLPVQQTVCAPADAVYAISIGQAFATNVTLTADNLPSGLTASFSANPAAPGSEVTLTLSGTGNIAAGSYTITISGTDGTDSATSDIVLHVVDAAPGVVNLSMPADDASGVSVVPGFSWQDVGADSYDIEIATDPAFANVVLSANGITDVNWTSSTPLSPLTTYYWHVKAFNVCGESDWSSTFSFATSSIACAEFLSEDVPIAISPDGMPTIVSTLEVNFPGSIEDVNVVNLTGTHTWINDLTFTLTSPEGTTVVLVDQSCDDEDNFNVNFDDQASNTTLPCPYDDGGTYVPLEPLSSFNGENAQGTWTLTVIDNADFDGGSLESWGLSICVIPQASIWVSQSFGEICENEDFSFEVVAGQGFSGDVDLSISGAPAGATVSYSVNPVAVGDTATITLSGVMPAGNYTIEVSGTDGDNNAFSIVQLTVNPPTAAPVLTQPADQATQVELSPTFTWEAVANVTSYVIEVASDPDILTLVESNTSSTNSYDLSTSLELSTTYYWRVTASGPCGTATSEVFSFTTGTTGINELAGRSIRLLPNPASEEMVVRFSSPLTEQLTVELFDARGKNLALRTYDAGTVLIQWPVKHLPEGIYFMRFHTEGSSAVQRIVVQH